MESGILDKLIIGLSLSLLILFGCDAFEPIEREGLSTSFTTTTEAVNQADVSENEATITVANSGENTVTIEKYFLRYYDTNGAHIESLDKTVIQLFDIASDASEDITVNVAPSEVVAYAKARPTLRELSLRITFTGTEIDIFGDVTLLFYHSGLIHFENMAPGGSATVIVEDTDLNLHAGSGNDQAYVTMSSATSGVTFPGGTLITLDESNTEGQFTQLVGWYTLGVSGGTTVTITATYDDDAGDTGSAPTTNPTATYSYVE